MGNSFGKIDDVTFSSTEQLSAAIYLDFTGLDQKCFIGPVMKVRRGNVARRHEKPQHGKSVSRLFRTYENMRFLPKRPYNMVVVDSQRFGFNFLVHGLTNANPPLVTGFLLALVSDTVVVWALPPR